MARAKNTSRAQARRNYREQTRAEGADALDTTGMEAVDVAPQPRQSMFRMPNIREDLRILPGMLRSEWKLWIPFLMLFGSFLLALAYWSWHIVPESMAGLVSLVVSLILQPTGLFVFFIGGFLAPRASYLVGAVLGLVDGILFSLLVLLVPAEATTPPGSTPGTTPGTVSTGLEPGQFVAYVGIAVLVGILAAGFAAWYRNFLRSSQERARQNRAMRDQQAKVKAKEDARLAREAQRQGGSGKPR